MSRRKARILALEALYAYEITNAPSEDILQFGWLPEPSGYKDDELAYSRILVAGTIENRKRIDKIIRKHLENWELSRLKRVDLAILRFSVYSLLYHKEIPVSVIIDEAVELSSEYSTDDSYKFINAVLDGIKKTLTGEKPDMP
ncbi:MAG: transcription antitermination factor NusB [Spirochaetaceae bacterium]|jgi:N utilization substance protein B|nr:transcription antitermination factor NusB [Spirochaetaceae bacterium]